MSGASELSKVGQLVLARLLIAGKNGVTTSELKKALEPLLGHRWPGLALGERLDRALGELQAAGLVERTRKGKTERASATDEGRQQALDLLGLEHLPPRTTWDTLKKVYLTARALDLVTPAADAARSFGSDDGLKTVLLRSQFGLSVGEDASLDEAIDALAWSLLGLPSGKKFDATAVKAALIRRALGDYRDGEAKPDPKQETARLLAQRLGAERATGDELRAAAIRRWVDADEAAVKPDRPVLSPPLDLETFARRVSEAARLSRSGWFGDDKVFVAHVWRALRDDPAFAALGPEGFKDRLAEANDARLLDLSRADRVEAMNSQDVRLSEVTHRGATFHFIRA